LNHPIQSTPSFAERPDRKEPTCMSLILPSHDFFEI
jgi:hypothetical protein